MNKEIRDQLAHGAVSIAALAPVAHLPCIWTGLFGGLVIGLLAELKEEASSVSSASLKAVVASRRSLFDISGYAAFGAIVGLIA